jgi:hypothetical protein
MPDASREDAAQTLIRWSSVFEQDFLDASDRAFARRFTFSLIVIQH